MEVYRNSEPTLAIPVPLATASYTYTVTSSMVTEPEAALSAPVDTQRSTIAVTIPFQHTQYDGTVTVDISMQRNDGLGGTYSFKEYVDVETPLFTWHDLDGNYPRDATPELERLVRKVVETYTGQNFGRKVDRVQGVTSQQVIEFSAPLIMLTDLSWGGRHAPLSTTLNPPKIPYETIANGFGIIVDWNNYDPKTDSLWIIRSDTPRIVNIEGIFGYDRVPQDVKEAALLIAGVWGTKQAVWRDRFIQTMRSADWSVQYHERAFLSTGSVTADQLLSKYQRTALPEVF